MAPGLDNLKHIVVLMMENRSFDHMLGALKKVNPRINGLNGNEFNPDTNGNPVPVAARGLSGPTDRRRSSFSRTDLQIFGGQTGDSRAANMQGFVKAISLKPRTTSTVPKRSCTTQAGKAAGVAATLQEFALFNNWFPPYPGLPSAIAPSHFSGLPSAR
jgi:phospholipase C